MEIHLYAVLATNLDTEVSRAEISPPHWCSSTDVETSYGRLELVVQSFQATRQHPPQLHHNLDTSSYKD